MWIICATCDEGFESDPVEVFVGEGGDARSSCEIFGRGLYPSVCDNCAHKLRKCDPEQRQHVTPSRKDRNQEWESMVGPYYNNFDAGRLPSLIRPHTLTTLG